LLAGRYPAAISAIKARFRAVFVAAGVLQIALRSGRQPRYFIGSRLAAGGVYVGGFEVLDGPAGCDEQRVDGLAGLFFGIHPDGSGCSSGRCVRKRLRERPTKLANDSHAAD